jgi:hypothetical protein
MYVHFVFFYLEQYFDQNPQFLTNQMKKMKKVYYAIIFLENSKTVDIFFICSDKILYKVLNIKEKKTSTL